MKTKIKALEPMRGTEGTKKYKTLVSTHRGAVAFRDLHDGTFRVRVEPRHDDEIVAKLSETLARSAGWKQPGDSGQHRFSKVVGTLALHETLAKAQEALGVGELLAYRNLSAFKVLKHATAPAPAPAAPIE